MGKKEITFNVVEDDIILKKTVQQSKTFKFKDVGKM